MFKKKKRELGSQNTKRSRDDRSKISKKKVGGKGRAKGWGREGGTGRWRWKRQKERRMWLTHYETSVVWSVVLLQPGYKKKIPPTILEDQSKISRQEEIFKDSTIAHLFFFLQTRACSLYSWPFFSFLRKDLIHFSHLLLIFNTSYVLLSSHDCNQSCLASRWRCAEWSVHPLGKPIWVRGALVEWSHDWIMSDGLASSPAQM